MAKESSQNTNEQDLTNEAPFHFRCQICGNVLKQDSSFYFEHAQQLLKETSCISKCQDDLFDSELATTVLDADEITTETAICRSYVNIYDSNGVEDTAYLESLKALDGFDLIGEFPPDAHVGTQIEKLQKVFEILSSNTPIQHPLCSECAQTLIDRLDEELVNVEKDCNLYRGYLQALQSASLTAYPQSEQDSLAMALGVLMTDPSTQRTGETLINVDEGSSCDDENGRLRDDLRQLDQEESELIQQIQLLQREHQKIEVELKRQTAKHDELVKEEKNYRNNYNKFARQKWQLADLESSQSNQLAVVEQLLGSLNQTHMLNASFHIWYYPPDKMDLVVVNGFRFGRSRKYPVDWEEVNVAWGLMALFLECMREIIGLRWDTYTIRPYGCESVVERTEPTGRVRKLPLYRKSSYGILETGFDSAMVGFLDCVRQLMEHIQKKDPQLHFPHKIVNDYLLPASGQMSKVSIKLQSSGEDERWCRALKWMAVNLKWSLSWVAKNYP